MKKQLMFLMALILMIGIIAGCGSSSNNSSGSDNSTNSTSSSDNTSTASSSKTIDDLKVSFVPSKDPDQIITATEPLKQLLIDQLGKEGYTVNKVDINVGTNYEAVGEALDAGTTDIGFIPGGTYVLYDKGADVILTATRAGLNNDSDNPVDWNNNKPTTGIDKQVTYYRSLLIAGPSKKGQELAQKVNSGKELTWDDLNSAKWEIMSSSSSAGYIYPTLWLQSKYKKSLTDLAHVDQADSYTSAFAALAQGQADVIAIYADARRDNEKKWTSDFGRKNSIWDETNVIGVTQGIFNDTISVSKNDKIMTPEFKSALQDAFIAIAGTDEGKKVIAIYSHEGYQKAQSSDYDGERAAQKLIQSMKK